MMMVQRNRRK